MILTKKKNISKKKSRKQISKSRKNVSKSKKIMRGGSNTKISKIYGDYGNSKPGLKKVKKGFKSMVKRVFKPEPIYEKVKEPIYAKVNNPNVLTSLLSTLKKRKSKVGPAPVQSNTSKTKTEDEKNLNLLKQQFLTERPFEMPKDLSEEKRNLVVKKLIENNAKRIALRKIGATNETNLTTEQKATYNNIVARIYALRQISNTNIGPPKKPSETNTNVSPYATIYETIYKNNPSSVSSISEKSQYSTLGKAKTPPTFAVPKNEESPYASLNKTDRTVRGNTNISEESLYAKLNKKGITLKGNTSTSEESPYAKLIKKGITGNDTYVKMDSVLKTEDNANPYEEIEHISNLEGEAKSTIKRLSSKQKPTTKTLSDFDTMWLNH